MTKDYIYMDKLNKLARTRMQKYRDADFFFFFCWDTSFYLIYDIGA